LPHNLSFEQGTLVELLAICVYFVIELSKLKLGEFVLVSGAGIIGILAAFVAKTAGINVILVGMSCDVKRLKIGKEMGIDKIVNV
jgi:threonine dehydrogenase-like Zn-dependent dehydrogenase